MGIPQLTIREDTDLQINEHIGAINAIRQEWSGLLADPDWWSKYGGSGQRISQLIDEVDSLTDKINARLDEIYGKGSQARLYGEEGEVSGFTLLHGVLLYWGDGRTTELEVINKSATPESVRYSTLTDDVMDMLIDREHTILEESDGFDNMSEDEVIAFGGHPYHYEEDEETDTVWTANVKGTIDGGQI